MDRVFLDANVLFSAACRRGAGLSQLWRLRGVQLFTSGYAVAEATQNLETVEQRRRLQRLLRRVQVVSEPEEQRTLPPGVPLPDKDRPILAAAVAASATHLLTGDLAHFGALFGRRVLGVLVQRPAEYLAGRNPGTS